MLIGEALGPYRVLEKLGEGGMGEVYRARDTRLNRDVAVKVLPPLFAADPERLARFEREAQVLASLNHPNIAHIYGLERRERQEGREGQTSTAFIAMELVEGPTLADRLTHGALPLAEALPIARQMADALDAAHEHGIVHRDLKPANVKVREDGTVKVLDFGLAKAFDPGTASSGAAMNSPTLSVHGTMQGVILGTAAYMAPEQAKGRPVDKRADIWAFGVVLYEMLTGRRAFAGDSLTEVLGAVVLKDPDWSALPATTPARLRDLLRRCLQKDPRARQRDIGDAKLELAEILAGRDVTPVADSRARTPLTFVAAAVLAAAAMGVVIGWGLTRKLSNTAAATTRFIVDGPGETEPDNPLLTPDGRFLVFVTDRLYKRDLSAFTATPLPGTEGASSPFMSPDGRWIGFFANGKIKKVSLAGGDPLTLSEASSAMPGAAWGPGDTVLFSPGWATGLFSLPADGGEKHQITEPDRKLGERGHWRPRVLPGGQRVLFTIWMAGSGVNDARVGVLDLNTGQHRALFPGADAQYLQSGHVVYFHAGAWHIVPFDAAAGKAIGDPITVLDDALGVAPDGGEGHLKLSASDSGTLAYVHGPIAPKRELVWADRNGTLEPLGLPPRPLQSVALSPDGRRVAVSRLEGGTFELWMNDVERKTEDRLDIKGNNLLAIWDSRGETFAFVSERKGEYDVYRARPDGTDVRPLLTNDFDELAWAWTHDGRRLIVQEWHPDGSTPLMLIEPGAGNKRQVLIPGTNPAGNASLSPDERWLAYSSSSSGRPEVYVQPFPGGTLVVRVSSGGGTEQLWSPSSNEIFFRHDKDLVSVSYHQDGGRLVFGSEKPMFRLPPSTVYGITRDGRRFLIGRLAEPEPPRGIRVVINWFAELKEKVK